MHVSLFLPSHILITADNEIFTSLTDFSVMFKALMLNCKSKGKSTAGELVNLMSVDAQRLMQIITYINCLWSSPLQIGVALFFLYNTLGLSVLAGLGVMLLLVPLNMLFGSRMGALQVIVCYYFVLEKILKVHDNIDQFIALLLLFFRALSFRK